MFNFSVSKLSCYDDMNVLKLFITLDNLKYEKPVLLTKYNNIKITALSHILYSNFKTVSQNFLK